MTFTPRFQYTHATALSLMTIEGARRVVDLLPLPPDTSFLLRQEARHRSTHSSTQIEGNPLSEIEVRRAIARSDRTPTDAEQEVRNYWRALDRVEEWAESGLLSEDFIQELHRTVSVRGSGRRGRRSPYRVGECPVVDTVTQRIDYAPPRPRDVPPLMADLIAWFGSRPARELPAPVRAAILSHRFLSIHPFDDGNGRTGRLLATAALWSSSYRMRGFLSFDEFFASRRGEYYASLQMDQPVDFYEGRHNAELTPWVEYFVGVVAEASDKLLKKAALLYQASAPPAPPWERLSRRQQQVLMWLATRRFLNQSADLSIRPADLQEWFGISANTARDWLREWAANQFVDLRAGAKGLRIRVYPLATSWRELLDLAQPGTANSASQAVVARPVTMRKRGNQKAMP